jgi:hypothetical protein
LFFGEVGAEAIGFASLGNHEKGACGQHERIALSRAGEKAGGGISPDEGRAYVFAKLDGKAGGDSLLGN